MLPTTPCHPWTGPHPGVLFAFSSFSGTKFCPLGLLQLSVYGGSEDCCQPTPKSVDSYKQKKISIICVPRGVSTVFCFFREDSRWQMLRKPTGGIRVQASRTRWTPGSSGHASLQSCPLVTNWETDTFWSPRHIPFVIYILIRWNHKIQTRHYP